MVMLLLKAMLVLMEVQLARSIEFWTTLVRPGVTPLMVNWNRPPGPTEGATRLSGIKSTARARKKRRLAAPQEVVSRIVPEGGACARASTDQSEWVVDCWEW